MSVLIRGVRPYGEGERVDVLVDDGQIAQIGPDLAIPDTADVIDATGHVLLPGFVDLHTHLREPGREYAEDIETGSPRPLWAATPRCSRWPTPTPWPTARWSPTTSGTAASRSAWSTCTPSARSPSGWPEPS